MDVLSDVLRTVRLRSHVQGSLELTRPWGFRIEGECAERALFYVVVSGSGLLEVDGLPAAVSLSGGDFVLVPHGGAHTVRDSVESRAVPIAQIGAEENGAGATVRRHGGGQRSEGAATILAGCFTFEGGATNPLVTYLPPLLHVRAPGGDGAPWSEMATQIIAAEAARAEPGAEAVSSRLAELLLVKALRAYLSTDTAGGGGWLQALKDPQIAAALRLMHEKPEQPWTIEGLAERVAMSRSAFAERFTRLVGEAPLGYLTRWRMHQAARLILEGDATLGAIARAVGYETGSAFGKAFRRHLGTSPGEYRKTRVLSSRNGHDAIPSPGSDITPHTLKVPA